jgi:hypothetical protein
MPDNNYATKQDIERIETRLEDMRAQLIEATRDMQTEVLRAFHNWGRPADIKFRSHEERLTLLEERITEIERQRPS